MKQEKRKKREMKQEKRKNKKNLNKRKEGAEGLLFWFLLCYNLSIIKDMKNRKGFTSMEVMLVIAIIIVLAATVVVVIDPFTQMAKTKDLERKTHLEALRNAIDERVLSRFGDWGCVVGEIPSEITGESPVFVKIGSGGGEYDLCSCLVPDHLSTFPVDPQEGQIEDSTSCENYYSGYEIWQNPETGNITLRAPYSEAGEVKVNY